MDIRRLRLCARLALPGRDRRHRHDLRQRIHHEDLGGAILGFAVGSLQHRQVSAPREDGRRVVRTQSCRNSIEFAVAGKRERASGLLESSLPNFHLDRAFRDDSIETGNGQDAGYEAGKLRIRTDVETGKRLVEYHVIGALLQGG